jgi:DNA-binding PadR family transcriptional regulator
MHGTLGDWLRGGSARYCMGRGHRPFGFGAVFGHGETALHGFRSGRKLGADDLQLLILALLEEKPRHGYEIIKALEERSGGFYSPSPGTIYPALTYLEELGYASVEVEGTKKSYHITDTGREKLDERRAFAEAIFAQLRWIARRMGGVRRVFGGTRAARGAADAQSSDEPTQWRDELNDARRSLRAALYAKFDADDDEQLRVAEILRRATAEILQAKR